MVIYQSTLKIVCLTLFKNDSLSIFEIHQKYRLPLGEIASTLNYLKNKKLILIEGMNIQITMKFKPWAYKNRASIFLTTGNMPWKNIDHFKVI